MLINAAVAIADCVGSEQLNTSYIIPSVFDQNVSTAVSKAVQSDPRKIKINSF